MGNQRIITGIEPTITRYIVIDRWSSAKIQLNLTFYSGDDRKTEGLILTREKAIELGTEIIRLAGKIEGELIANEKYFKKRQV